MKGRARQTPPPLPKNADESLHQLRQDLSKVAPSSPSTQRSLHTPLHRHSSVGNHSPSGESGVHYHQQSFLPPRGPLAPIRDTPAKLLNISPSDEPDVQRHTLLDWMSGYSVELSTHQSSIVAAELLLHQVIEGTRELQRPNPLRTAAVCCAVEQLSESMPRYAAVMRPALKELFDAIYVPVGATPSQEFVAASLANLGIGSHEIVRLQKFLSRKPFFESLWENEVETAKLEQRMSEVASRQGKGHATFSNAISNWQSSYLRCVFSSWRAVVSSSRKNRYLLNGFFRHVNRRDTLQTHFFAWRAFTKDAKLDHFRSQYQEGIDQVVQQEAVSNARFLEADDAREELRLTCLRLKENEDKLLLEKSQLELLSENSIAAAEGWRSVTIDVVNFMASLRKIISSSHKVSGEGHYNKAYELAVKVILGWAASIISHLPQSHKVRTGNFLSDVRDGTLLILVLHVVTNGDVSLSVLEKKDIPSRMEVVLDTLNSLDIQLFLALEHLIISPSADVFFLILFSLWERFALPPLADGNVCVGYSNGFRNDLTQTRDYLDLMKAFYPSWFEQRNILQRFALYIAAGRSQGGSASVAANEETRLRQELQGKYIVTNSLLVPSVFLCSVTLNPTQRFQNDEELLRVNDVIGKHVALIDAIFNFYSFSRDVVSTTVKRSKGNEKKQAQLEVEHAVTGNVREMDVFSFYRFCADCGLLKSGDELMAASGNTAGMASIVKKKVMRNAAQQQADAKVKEPSRFSKIQCYEMFVEVVSKFRTSGPATSSSSSAPAAAVSAPPNLASLASHQSAPDMDISANIIATPVAFSALLLHLAIHRYGQPVLPSSMQPAPGSVVLESLINSDVAPKAGTHPQLPFLRDLFTNEPQEYLVSIRTLLRKFFMIYASLHHKTAMVMGDWVAAMTSILPSQFEGNSTQSSLSHQAASADGVASMLQRIFIHVSQLYVKNGESKQNDDAGEGSLSQSLRRSSPPGVDPGGGVASFLVYGEFEVAIAAVAVERSPSPFLPMKDKLQRFFAEHEPALNDVVFAPPTVDNVSVGRGGRVPTESEFSSSTISRSVK